MNTSNELSIIREQIDEIDDQIIPLLVRRTALALEASKFKHTRKEVRGEDRVAQVLDRVATRARAAGGYQDSVQTIYRAIIAELTQLQLVSKGLTEQ